MDAHTLDIHQQRACDALQSAAFDFTAKFYAANDLYNIARQDTERIDIRSIEAVKGVLLSTTFDAQRQRRFLFREAANMLSTLVQIGCRQPIAKIAHEALLEILHDGRDHAHQAAAEALGGLPLGLVGPEMSDPIQTEPLVISWHRLGDQKSFGRASQFAIKGRSLIACLPDDKMVVIKMARKSEEIPALSREVQWMDYIGAMQLPVEYRFDVPKVLNVKGAALFRISGLPSDLKPCGVVDDDIPAIGFVSSNGYFCYPNDRRTESFPDAEAFIEMMGRNAYLFGWLTGQGIVHDAPIPLFHNRIQQDRRRDGGLYEWFRAGRLDRWLDSSAYPNFGQSGLRDFEHFTSYGGNKLTLYRYMGNQFLSLLLVAGSYFRSKDPHLVGWDNDGAPIDTRALFDRDLLSQVVSSIYHNYYLGFVGESSETSAPMNIGRTVERMIEEMGVDRHMDEYLRVVDQRQMSQESFEGFLKDRGYEDGQIAGITKGAQDLAIHSGPHLGAFNRGISLPEIIEAAAAMAAVCVAKRYLRDRYPSDPISWK